MSNYNGKTIDIVRLRSYDDRTLGKCWRAIVKEGKADRVCVITDPRQWGEEGFIRQVRAGNDVRVVLINDRPVAVLWIESVRPRRAEVHWHLYSDGLRDMIEIGRAVVNKLFDSLGVDLLYGFTPTNNLPAIRYLVRLGAQQAGTLPGGSYIAKENRSVDSAIMCFVRKNEGLPANCF
jgi:RimJ/RimL family protein N-acetyltransferase